ncbi:hypothetical protein TI39_contig840g00010 [Zymoseptoria brevis]|uniref:Uncharacterized protein n=1 Tax=Zymoseptoria brevis TaxID=1047168 RepID=A0A0F4GF60_9PEZI|nr:hypothetical protein TI39_contig840g00010 [Zymoseptoria brevis]
MGGVWEESESEEAGRPAREDEWNGQFYAKDKMDVDESEDEEMGEEDSESGDMDAMAEEKSTDFSNTPFRADSDDGPVNTPALNNFTFGSVPLTNRLPQVWPDKLQRRPLTSATGSRESIAWPPRELSNTSD